MKSTSDMHENVIGGLFTQHGAILIDEQKSLTINDEVYVIDEHSAMRLIVHAVESTNTRASAVSQVLQRRREQRKKRKEDIVTLRAENKILTAKLETMELSFENQRADIAASFLRNTALISNHHNAIKQLDERKTTGVRYVEVTTTHTFIVDAGRPTWFEENLWLWIPSKSHVFRKALVKTTAKHKPLLLSSWELEEGGGA